MVAIIQIYWKMLLGALGKTLLLCLLSLCFAMIIGMIFGLLNVGKNRAGNLIGTIYVDAIRGVPLIVLAYFIYFGVPAGIKMMGVQDFRLTALAAGTIALSLNCGAYMAEIIRAGIGQRTDGGEQKPWIILCQEYAPCRASAGNPDNDPVYHQPVHHHTEGYLDFICYRFPGTDKHG